MDRNYRNRIPVLIFVTVVVFMIGSPILPVDAIEYSSNLNVGPYVDKVVYKVVEDAILSIQSGDIHVTLGTVGVQTAIELAKDPDIEINRVLRNGYGHITINCGKYPLNISAFRRAFAFAFDKTRVTIDAMEGMSQEHDSMLPYNNPWCIEDDLPYHYYTAQVDKGNQLLDAAGFTLDPITGFRHAPDGTEFSIRFEYFATDLHLAIVQIAMDAFAGLHVNAYSRPSSFSELMPRLDVHGDYDMVMYATNFIADEANWLVNEFRSEYADVPYQNPCNFQNDTFDLWRNQALYGTSYEEIYEALAALQLILHENVPRIITYQNVYFQPYRIDEFTGYVADKARYMASQWTLRKVHKIDGTSGGTFYVQNADPQTFNIFLYGDLYSGEVLLNLWPRLYSHAPDVTPWPYLAESLNIETHTDNSAVPDGHTRFTIDIIQNATWSDGTPLTAEDVAFSFNYLLESQIYGNPKSFELMDLMAVYAPTPYRVIIEFSTESWWHFSNFAYVKLFPEHIFNDDTGIGYAGWNTWNPVFDPAEPYVTSGPFTLTDHVIGEFYELTANPDFAYYPQSSTTTTTTTTTTTNGTEPPNQFNLTLSLTGGTIGAASVIVVGGFLLFKRKW